MIRRLDRPWRLAAMPPQTRKELVDLRRALAVGRCGCLFLEGPGQRMPDPFARELGRLELLRREELER